MFTPLTIEVNSYDQILQKETYLEQQSNVLDQGLNIITGNDIKLSCPPEVLYTDPSTGVKSMYYKVAVTRCVLFEEIGKMNKKGQETMLMNEFYF